MSSTSPLPDSVGDTVAAVDLGSNSFHMIVARSAGAELQVVDRLKEPVRLAAGLDENRKLEADAQARALECLERFGQRLRHLPSSQVRVVGTNTLRRARGIGGFLQKAEAALGHPIDIIYGAEEGRLIYRGVAQDLAGLPDRRLVMDIGGSSTEIIAGQEQEPVFIESLSLGAVVHSQRYFADGKISKSAWKAAVLNAQVIIEPVRREFREAGWDVAVGASGSIKAVQKVCADAGWCGDQITHDAIQKLGKALIKAGHIDKFESAGLSDDRRPIFAGGTAVLTALFESLGLKKLMVSEKALREGVVLDLLGRMQNEDVREQSVAATLERYACDVDHAQRVSETAQRLLDQVGSWVKPVGNGEALLHWAALLHEIGLAISHKGYHKHGEYIVRNCDLQGFSRTEQTVLAGLVRLHRGKFRPEVLQDLPENQRRQAMRLAILLRLAVLLHRGRDPEAEPPVELSAEDERLLLEPCPDWLADHPLTEEDLLRERDLLTRADFTLDIQTV